jgi:CNT family concentrative nucleoside transporter
MERFAPLLGLLVLLGIGYLCSTDRRRVPWRLVGAGTGVQVYLALFLVRADWVPWMLSAAAAAVVGILILSGRFGEGSFWVLAAQSLGWLGVLTTLVHALSLGFVAFGLLLLAVAVAVPFVPAPREAFRSGGAIGGSLAVVALVWAGGLPHDFLFRGLMGVGAGIYWLVGRAGDGAGFVFGGLERGPFVFAIDVGAIILLFSALTSALYYVGVLPRVVGLLARLLHRALGVSGAESLATASNVFLGQTEAPLVVRPYLARMTRSEITALMTGGFATIAGSVFGAYVKMLAEAGFERGAADLIAASVMSAPAAFVFAKLFVPETEAAETAEGAAVSREEMGTSLLDSLAKGVTAGTRLAVNVIAMLLVFWALIAMLDRGVGWASGLFGGDLTFRQLYAPLFAPLAFLMGVPWTDCWAVGELLGTKTIFNEFIAYQDLGTKIRDGTIGERSAILSTYALCGFANFMSIGVQIGGLSALAPGRRADFVRLAFRAMVAGTLACQMTACIVAVVS